MKTTKNESEFGIEQLFGSRTRARLLQLFLDKPDQPFFVRELARKTDAQLNSVRREIQNLVDFGLLTEQTDVVGEDTKVTRKKFYSVNKNFILFEELRALFGRATVMMQHEMVREIINGQAVQMLVLAGSFVGNKNQETDMLIVGVPDMRIIQERVGQFEQMIGREVNYTVMPHEEYQYRREVSDRFLTGLLDGRHMLIEGVMA